MSFWGWLLRISLCLINGVFMLVAVLMTGYSVYVKANFSQLLAASRMLNIPVDDLDRICTIVAGVGACLFIVSTLGIVGALWTNKSCLVSFSTIMLLCVLAEIICVVLIWTNIITIDIVDTFIQVFSQLGIESQSFVYFRSALNQDMIHTSLNTVPNLEIPTGLGVVEQLPIKQWRWIANYMLNSTLTHLVAGIVFLQYTAAWCSSSLIMKAESKRCYSEEAIPLCPADRSEPNTMVYNEHYHNKAHHNGYQ